MRTPEPNRAGAGDAAGLVIPPPRIRRLGQVDYEPAWKKMQAFTDTREPGDADQIWVLQHPPVFTLGKNASMQHVLAPGDIPLVRIDRGGQVTYHGPGQLVVYPLVDIDRLDLNVRELVCALEQAIVRCVAGFGIEASGDRDAPGVYVAGRKLASLGLRIRRGCAYHGLALNVDLDLEPFSRINPCGYAGLEVTRLADLGVDAGVDEVADRLVPELLTALGLPDRDIPDQAAV
jgi:lipoyl(octanoyl) transferase